MTAHNNDGQTQNRALSRSWAQSVDLDEIEHYYRFADSRIVKLIQRVRELETVADAAFRVSIRYGLESDELDALWVALRDASKGNSAQ